MTIGANAMDIPSFETLFERDGLKVSRSPWGAADNIGRLNLMTAESRQAILSRAEGNRVYDLAVDYFIGMPSWAAAGDPRYQMWMTHTPEGSVNDRVSGATAQVHEKYSYCGDSISMYTHTGTHIDMLNHLGHYGQFWNGRTAEKDLGSRQWLQGGAGECPPIVGRAVMLDVAFSKNVDCLPDGYCIEPDDLLRAARTQNTELCVGDIILIRTGRMSRWPDFEGYIRSTPGIGIAAAKFLCEEVGVMCIGTDAISIDVDPHQESDSFVPVHGYLFATAGTPVIEVLNLEELSAEKVYEIMFIGMPLKLRGATGSPIRPIGLPLSTRA
jgi:kynurenine formamidase